MTTMPHSTPLTRRRILYLAGAGTAGVALASCGGDTPTSSEFGSATSQPGTGNASSPDCVLTPEETEGPFYTNLNLVRRDITDGRVGSMLDLRFTVIDADTCTPIPDAAIDIWHADAGGLYSAFIEQGDDEDIDTTAQSFLRGVQPTDANGIATFSTIYPGWYSGRTTHVHLKVHFDNNTRVTSQLFFPDETTTAIYNSDAYAERGPKDTSNDNDDLSAENPSLRMAVTQSEAGHLATHTLGISRN